MSTIINTHFKDILYKDSELTFDEIVFLLNVSDKNEIKELYKRAYEVKLQHVGNKVFFRGLIELSNHCSKNCYYCGIRRDNHDVVRYTMEKDEIVQSALWCYENQYGSVVLQSGERSDQKFIDFIEDILMTIRNLTDSKLGITISLGEQEKSTYQRWFIAGALRYLLRIEASNKELYHKMHPVDHSYSKRLKCLYDLKEIGYQVGTGIMIGLPEQSIENIAEDIMFFRNMDIDMIGMGPYIVHNNTPMAEKSIGKIRNYDEQLELALKTIAITRIFLKDVNIASTTALQTLNPEGRELGLLSGANVIMPNVSDTKYRKYYQLYENKPCLDENSSMCKNCLSQRITSIGEVIGYNEQGNPPHFTNKNKIK